MDPSLLLELAMARKSETNARGMGRHIWAAQWNAYGKYIQARLHGADTRSVPTVASMNNGNITKIAAFAPVYRPSNLSEHDPITHRQRPQRVMGNQMGMNRPRPLELFEALFN